MHNLSPRPTYNFRMCDFTRAADMFSVINWDVLFEPFSDINDCVKCFMDVINNVILRTVPLRANVAHFRSRRIPQSIRNLVLRKRAAWRRFMRTRSVADRHRFVQLSKQARRLSRAHCARVEYYIATSRNKQSFYAYINKVCIVNRILFLMLFSLAILMPVLSQTNVIYLMSLLVVTLLPLIIYHYLS